MATFSKKPLVVMRMLLEEIIADEGLDQDTRDSAIQKVAELNRQETKKKLRRRA